MDVEEIEENVDRMRQQSIQLGKNKRNGKSYHFKVFLLYCQSLKLLIMVNIKFFFIKTTLKIVKYMESLFG